jgi:hypothetical protein
MDASELGLADMFRVDRRHAVLHASKVVHDVHKQAHVIDRAVVVLREHRRPIGVSAGRVHRINPPLLHRPIR